MSTLAMAWDAFQAAIAEAQALHASGADIAAIQDLLQHARELLDPGHRRRDSVDWLYAARVGA